MFQVLNIHAYEARQREYALQGHRHFYFMTLNGSEVCFFPLHKLKNLVVVNMFIMTAK